MSHCEGIYVVRITENEVITLYIFDAHIDTLLRFIEEGLEGQGLRMLTGGHVSLEKIQAAGIGGQIFAVFVPPRYRQGLALHKALQMVEIFWKNMETLPDHFGVIQSSEDVLTWANQGKVGALLSLEGGEPLQGEISHLHLFYRLGVRAITLTWNHRNELADGVGERDTAYGLSRFGCLVVEEMNRLGMIIDVSHLSETGFWDVIKLSKDPIMASHSNARVLRDHPRNLWDNQIKAIADTGGVIGVNFCPAFVTDTDKQKATIDHLVEHICYLVEVGGSNSVGLGSDYDGITETPIGLEDISTVGTLSQKLRAKGYKEDVIEKIMGGNFQRLIRQVLPKKASE